MDPRLISAAALMIVGVIITRLAVRIWFTHSINRVFSLGPFVTAEGLEALLKNSFTIFMLGVFALSSAAARFAYWARWNEYLSTEVAHLFGLIEALFATWAAAMVVLTGWRLWQGR